MLRNLFNRSHSGNRPSESPTLLSGPRVPRHSSSWASMLKHLKSESNLRILDIGPTSPSSINFLTGLGHSVYMADIVHEAMKPNWIRPVPAGEDAAPEQYDTEGFLEHNLKFSGRLFDIVLLWTTLDYLPPPMIVPVIDRIHSSMQPGGQILALFHSKNPGNETSYCRYHLTDSDDIEMQESEPFAVRSIHTNRGIENLFAAYSNYRFFLAKDNVYEVIVTR